MNLGQRNKFNFSVHNFICEMKDKYALLKRILFMKISLTGEIVGCNIISCLKCIIVRFCPIV